jgi:hypothetical protein
MSADCCTFQVKGAGGSANLEAGWHVARVAEVTRGESRNGHPELKVRFETGDGSTATGWWYITEAAQWRAEELWHAAGVAWPTEDGEVDARELLGRTVSIEVVGTDKGGTRVENVAISESDIPADAPEVPAVSVEDDDEAPF